MLGACAYAGEANLFTPHSPRSTTLAEPSRTRKTFTPKFENRPLVCLSHLRWDLVFQRPQHLMTRFAQSMPVYFIEEPHFDGTASPSLARYEIQQNLIVLVPHLPSGITD